MCYHGTKFKLINGILLNGLKGFSGGMYVSDEVRAIYTSPSIEYASHPRYAQWYKHSDGKYYQFVFQCRIHFGEFVKERSETLRLQVALSAGDKVDPHFNNNDNLEWVVQLPDDVEFATRQQLLITGLYVRRSTNPYAMLQRHWWVIPYQGWTTTNVPFVDSARQCWKTEKIDPPMKRGITGCSDPACGCLTLGIALPVDR